MVKRIAYSKRMSCIIFAEYLIISIICHYNYVFELPFQYCKFAVLKLN